MAKELKSKLVLEIDDFSRKLTQAERETKKTIAAIERESGRGMASMRADMLGGIGAGNSVREMQAYKQEHSSSLTRSPGAGFDQTLKGQVQEAKKANEYLRDIRRYIEKMSQPQMAGV